MRRLAGSLGFILIGVLAPLFLPPSLLFFVGSVTWAGHLAGLAGLLGLTGAALIFWTEYRGRPATKPALIFGTGLLLFTLLALRAPSGHPAPGARVQAV